MTAIGGLIFAGQARRVVVLAIHVPSVIRMAVAGGPDARFWGVCGLVVAVVLAITVVNLVRVRRATVIGSR